MSPIRARKSAMSRQVGRVMQDGSHALSSGWIIVLLAILGISDSLPNHRAEDERRSPATVFLAGAQQPYLYIKLYLTTTFLIYVISKNTIRT